MCLGVQASKASKSASANLIAIHLATLVGEMIVQYNKGDGKDKETGMRHSTQISIYCTMGFLFFCFSDPIFGSELNT